MNITSSTSSEASHRKLSSVSVTNSVVSGNGTQNQLVRDNVTVTVVAKDSSGNSITTGGETFVLRVTSKCVAESIHLCSNNYYPSSQYIFFASTYWKKIKFIDFWTRLSISSFRFINHRMIAMFFPLAGR